MKKLSPRELQIMSLMKDGFKNRDIAINLGVNQKTVSTYLRRIKTKLEVSFDANAYITVRTYLKNKFATNPND